MYLRIRKLAALGLALTCMAAIARAQAAGKEPKRPKVEADMDTNDAQSFLLVAAHQLDLRPAVARDAFWWATKLDPGSAPAYYGLRMATILADESVVRLLLNGAKNERDRGDVRQLDSLDLKVELLDPFASRNLEGKWLARLSEVMGYTPQDVGKSFAKRGDYQFGLLNMWEGRLPMALEAFARSLRTAKVTSGIHALRGRIFQAVGNPDSALGSLKAAVDAAKKVEDTALVRFFQPKARYLYQMGWLYEALEKPALAREAYGQALVEDLSFYPAHQRLALLALAAGDTATAISEFDIGVQAGTEDVVLRLQYAYALAATRKLAEASQQVQQVIAKEPYYSDPYLMLARLYDATEMADLALVNYKAFLARSPSTDMQRGFAQDRVTALSAAGKKGGAS